ncbi:hypothetical protein N7466_000401 [Penicillium verhagenii]|uniref:uncharacterized protein n=1 Tax=Penicillium verhagenii TaxID=1562060 RepID=UPI002544E8CB|nr:uncharacterized protein N7466_000401 [Penicillium verhagenii]KAJ5947386.1 hypothetical protein N7466_000401 [Penicillium verhagenii]
MDPTRKSIEEHWQASNDNDIETEHAIYSADAILDYPQSGECFKGRAAISAQRGGHPAARQFTVLRISGDGHLWVSECIITYDGIPTYSVSIMQFDGELVVHETQYFTDKFGAPGWRAALAEPMPGRHIETL